MKCDRQHAREAREVVIRREDRKVISYRDRADEEVRVRSLDSSRTTEVEKRRRFLVILSRNRCVRKGSQMVAQSFKLRALPDPGQNLLPDRANDRNSAILNQGRELRTKGDVLRPRLTAERATRSACLPKPSSPTALLLVIILRVKIDGAEQLEDLRLLPALNVLLQRFGHGSLLGSVSADSLRLFEKTIINREIRRHDRTLTQPDV